MGLPLPFDIVEVIFSKLPIPNLSVCRLVCRAWNDLVLNSKFIISNGFLIFTISFDLNRTSPPTSLNSMMHCVDTDTLSSVASFEFETDLKRIVFHSSCNGLVFIFKGNQTRCAGILNPLTNEFFKVPGFKPRVQGIDDISKIGFGFSPKTRKYKLFRVFHEAEFWRGMEVFRFGTQEQWSSIHSTLPFAIHGGGVYLNGFVYWIARKGEGIDECVIYTVDVETEKIDWNVVLKLGHFPISMKIEPFNGTIYAVVYIFESSAAIELWRMQEKDSWVRDFVFDNKEPCGSILRSYYLVRLFHLVKAFEDGSILVLIKDMYYCLDKMERK